MAERALHIGVDGRELVGRVTGAGRYIGEVLRVWLGDAGWPHRITVIAPGARPAVFAAAGSRLEWVDLPAPRGGTWWEQFQLPSALGRVGVDVLFAGAYTAPLFPPCPFVVAIHDVSFSAHPEWFGAREGLRRRLLTRQAARRAAAVVTISEFSAGEIVRHCGIDRRRITIAAPGAPPPLDGVREPSGEPLVLSVGSLFNRRHIPELVAGFARAASAVPGAWLALVGDNRTRPHIDPAAVAVSCGVADRVEWMSYVGDEDLAGLYRRARVFVFLSSYEGFAMTPLEALAAGVPVVLFDTPVAREVYGDVARFVTLDPVSIGDALVTLLTDDRACRSAVEAGRALVARYQWTSTAARITHALEAAAGGRR